MTNDYTSSTDAFADISEGTFSSSDYPVMSNFVTVASRMIDNELGRWPGFFYPAASSTDPVSLYYDGTGDYCQPIDEFVSISQVAVAEQGGLSSTDYTNWTLNTDYIVKPHNYSALGRPINELEIVDFNGTKASWYRHQKSVKVAGVPGYSASPPDVIVQAAKIQAVRWFMRAKQGWQDTGANSEVGQLSYKGVTELDSDVKAMLWPLKLELMP
jgi:hypothetical protein